LLVLFWSLVYKSVIVGFCYQEKLVIKYSLVPKIIYSLGVVEKQKWLTEYWLVQSKIVLLFSMEFFGYCVSGLGGFFYQIQKSPNS
jgi:hypothetical protein